MGHGRARAAAVVLGALGLAWLTFALVVTLRHDPQLRPMTNIVVGAVAMAVGIAVAWLRPDARVALLGAAGLYCMGIHWEANAVNRALLSPAEQTVAVAGRFLGSPLQLVFGFWFFYLFPEGVRPSRVARVAGIALTAFAVASWAQRRASDLGLAVPLFSSRIRVLVVGALLLAICAVAARNYRVCRDPTARRRVRWVLLGAVVALLPEALAALIVGLLPVTLPDVGAYTALAAVALPLTLAYAVVRHQVLEIRVAFRRGLRYLLARNALRVIVALPALALVARTLASPERTVGDLLFASKLDLALLALALAALRWREPLYHWLDRRFFREQVEAERLVSALVTQVRSLDSLGEASELVVRELQEALHPTVVLAFHRDAASTDDALVSDRLAARPGLLLAAEGLDGPGEVGALALEPDDRRWLDEQKITLVVPMRGTERLAGLLLLGAKRSEEPYGAIDRRLLSSIANQMAFVYEALWLRERADRDRHERDILVTMVGDADGPMKECPACGECHDRGAARCSACGALLVHILPVARTLDGKYRLERRIGKGGMGAVYRATDLRLSRAVAVKLMTGVRFGTRLALRRFAREARASARLAHPNLVAVHDYGTLPGAEEAAGAYLVLELLEGRTMRTAMREPVAPATLARWFEGLLAGLAAAHRAGVVHRDLKPENVFLTHDGVVKILDFGLARLTELEPASAELTVPGMVVGTLGYMAPEQLEGRELDARADLWSVGVMVVEALLGRRPFTGRTAVELLGQVLGGEPALGIDPAVDAVLRRVLSRDATARHASADELSAALLPALRVSPPRALVAPALAEAETGPLSPG